MAASYWTSTQHLEWEDPTAESTDQTWTEDEQAVSKQFPLPEPRLVYAYLYKRLHQLGKKLALRQIVMATAMVYVRRFYQRVKMRRTNPYLLVVTAVYVACKIEECPHHIKIVLSEARALWSSYIQPDIAKLGECEFRLISVMNAQLVVHHPYRYLIRLQEHFQFPSRDVNTAWKVINDHYLTDLLFQCPPFVTAVASLVLAVLPEPSQITAEQTSSGSSLPESEHGALTADQQRLKDWLIHSEIDLEAVMDAVQQMIALYLLLDQKPDSDDRCKEQIARFVRAQGLEPWAG